MWLNSSLSHALKSKIQLDLITLSKTDIKMATQKSPNLNEPPTKLRKVEDQPNDVAVAVEEPPPPIFNLVNDCCFAILDCLSYDDLRSFGRTCKWAQQVAGNFYRMNHSAKVCSVNSSRFVSRSDAFDLENAQKIRIDSPSLTQYRRIEAYCNQSENQSIKQMDVFKLSIEHVDCLKKVLNTVEDVAMNRTLIFTKCTWFSRKIPQIL